MIRGEAAGVAPPHKHRGAGKPLAGRSVLTYAQRAKAACSVCSPCCGAYGRTHGVGRGVADSSSNTGRRGGVLLVKYREEGSADEGGAAAVKESPALSKSTTGRGVEEDEGLLTHVPVVFELGKHCTFGHSFAVVGDAPELGKWDTSKSINMQWSDGDVWRAGVSLPVDTPVTFKYIELADDGHLVAWGADVAAGGNMTVTVNRSDELISGYQVTMEPPMQTDPSPAAQPYLTARLDVAALLPMSASFFKEKQLAVSAGLPAAVAEDLMTDRVLAEQGLLSDADLEAKWSVEEMSALRGQFAEAVIAESLEGPTAAAAAAAGAAVVPDAGRMSTSLDYISETSDEEAVASVAATESEVILAAVDVTDPHAAAAVDVDADDDTIAVALEEQTPPTSQDADDDIIAATESEVIITAPDNDISESPATPSATAAATRPMHDETNAAASSTSAVSDTSGTVCFSPPKDTKLVSAGPSADSVDLSTPLHKLDSKAVVEFTADGVEPIDPIHVREGLAVPGSSSSSSSHVVVTKESIVEQQQGGSPVGIADVVTPSGVAHELSGVGSHEALLVGPEQAQALGVTQGEGLSNTDNLNSTTSLDENALAAAVAAAAAAAATVRYASQTAAAEQVELEVADAEHPSQAAAAAGAAAVRYAAQRAATEAVGPAADAGKPAEAAGEDKSAAAAAASTCYAGQAAAARAQEATSDAERAARAVDERDALLHGPGSHPSVAQVMSESAVAADGAVHDAEVFGVRHVADELRAAAQDTGDDRQQGGVAVDIQAAAEEQQPSKPVKKSGNWWRWILGKADKE
jgi:hypothetical protein